MSEEALRAELESVRQALDAALVREQELRAEVASARKAHDTVLARELRLRTELEATCLAHDAEMTRAQATLAHEQERHARTEHERVALLASTSWRLTAPLRWVVSLLRRSKA